MSIEDYIHHELSPEEQSAAMAFIRILQDRHLTFHKDNGVYWKDKIYYWVQSGDACVCFIAIKAPDEPHNHWTVWSADMGSQWLDGTADDSIKASAWKYVDHCGHCGSCGGGRHKVIFGKEFDDVCGCTFRIDNPQNEDMPFLKEMVAIRLKEISSRQSLRSSHEVQQ